MAASRRATVAGPASRMRSSSSTSPGAQTLTRRARLQLFRRDHVDGQQQLAVAGLATSMMSRAVSARSFSQYEAPTS